MKKICSCLFLILFSVCRAEPLPVDEAFKVHVKRISSTTLLVHFQIRPGYYLYQTRMHFSLPKNDIAILKHIQYPTKHRHIYHGSQVYHKAATLRVSIEGTHPGQTQLKMQYQGCKREGFCYAPQVRTLQLIIDPTLILSDAKILRSPPSSETTELLESLQHASFFWIVLSFYGLGILLAFTPCVLPLIPIIASLILGKHVLHPLTSRQAFRLTLTYVLAMSVSYALIGFVFAWLGENLQILLQSTVIKSLSGLLLILLALSMLGLYNIAMPVVWQTRLTRLLQNQGGHTLGIVFMGSLSALVLTPCVTPPLVAALIYIAHSGNTLLGASTLFCLSLGMGTPLLLFGTVGASWIPKTGAWMNTIKVFFGILLLLFATTLLFPSIRDLAFPSLSSQQNTVTTLSQMQAVLKEAMTQKQPVLLDFYADWCASCQTMKRTTFADLRVQKALSSIRFIIVDLTKMDKANRELLQYFNVIGPPTFIFLDPSGKEIPQSRLVGESDPETFLKFLEKK